MSDIINKIIKFLTGEDINELKRKIEKLEKEIEKQKNENNFLKFQNLKQPVQENSREDFEKKIKLEKDFKENWNKREKEILDEKEQEIAKRESIFKKDIEELSLKIENLNNQVKEYSKIEEILYRYKPLVQKMSKCPSLIFFNNKIKSKNEKEGLLKFVEIFGNGEDFLRDLYKDLKQIKVTEKEPLTNEELEFIKEINKYFKNYLLTTEDVLIIVNPGEDRFNKGIMQDILKASDFNFKTVETFYVPGVKTKSYTMKAIVKGRK
jgi:hypothetical protein